MRAMSKVINSVRIQSLSAKGGKSAVLKSDVVDMVFGLMNNDTLTDLDISGHQCGDAIAVVMAKVLQHNRTLSSLDIHNNGLTYAGLSSLLLGLKRYDRGDGDDDDDDDADGDDDNDDDERG